MGRANEPDIYRFAADSADLPNLPFLDKPQQSCLCGLRKLTNLIEEKGAAISSLDESHTVAGCACKGALLITKKFRFNE